MRDWRVLLERLRGVRRPPSGPLTTAEQTTADEVQEETLLRDTEQTERDEGERPQS